MKIKFNEDKIRSAFYKLGAAAFLLKFLGEYWLRRKRKKEKKTKKWKSKVPLIGGAVVLLLCGTAVAFPFHECLWVFFEQKHTPTPQLSSLSGHPETISVAYSGKNRHVPLRRHPHSFVSLPGGKKKENTSGGHEYAGTAPSGTYGAKTTNETKSRKASISLAPLHVTQGTTSCLESLKLR